MDALERKNICIAKSIDDIAFAALVSSCNLTGVQTDTLMSILTPQFKVQGAETLYTCILI